MPSGSWRPAWLRPAGGRLTTRFGTTSISLCPHSPPPSLLRPGPTPSSHAYPYPQLPPPANPPGSQRRPRVLLRAPGANAGRRPLAARSAVAAPLGNFGLRAPSGDVAEPLRKIADPVAEGPRRRTVRRRKRERVLELASPDVHVRGPRTLALRLRGARCGGASGRRCRGARSGGFLGAVSVRWCGRRGRDGLRGGRSVRRGRCGVARAATRCDERCERGECDGSPGAERERSIHGELPSRLRSRRASVMTRAS